MPAWAPPLQRMRKAAQRALMSARKSLNMVLQRMRKAAQRALMSARKSLNMVLQRMRKAAQRALPLGDSCRLSGGMALGGRADSCISSGSPVPSAPRQRLPKPLCLWAKAAQ